MPIIILKYKDNTIKEYSLEKGASLNIGRRENNDIVIANLVVSGDHAKIDTVSDGFLLTDLKSKNGTLVNSQRVNSHYLQDGDQVTIGKHSLVFCYADDEVKPGGIETGMDQTIMMGDIPPVDNDPVPSAPVQLSSAEKMGILFFLSGGNGNIELFKKMTKIGKDKSCDIVVSGVLVGKFAASISKTPDGYVLSYVSGMTKPRVNGQLIQESVPLEEYDNIKIGSVEMQFYYK